MILGANGRPYVQLGGEFSRAIHTRGDLVQSFQYVNAEPAMVIWSSTRKSGAFAICLSVAHEYLDDHYLMFQAMSCAHQIGYHPSDKDTVKRICDMILDGLDELVKMPPEPQDAVAKREQRAEVKLTNGLGGNVISHTEVLHDPFEQPA